MSASRLNPHMPHQVRLAVLIPILVLGAGCPPGGMVEIVSGFDLLPRSRPALGNDGTVVAATPTELIVGDGIASITIDLAASGLGVTAVNGAKRIQVRDEGELVFLAGRGGTTMGCPLFSGVYETTSAGGAISTVHETCESVSPGPAMGRSIGMSSNGTVAFSDIRNGAGAIYRYAVGSAPTVLHSGSGEFFNFGELDVNDAGQVPIQMEYFDGFAGGLMRGVFVFDDIEQDKLDSDTAVEKLAIGNRPAVAINDAGTVVLATNSNMSFPIDGVMYNFDAGVYLATPTLFNTPKILVPVATMADGYCNFGAVDINDAGTVVFEAQLDAGFPCNGGGYDGLFSGADPVADVVVERGDARLDSHQYFDSVYLGEINDSGQVSFATTYSEPLVPPFTIWRFDP